MVLDIGAKTTHVLFFEGEKFFFRTVNIGANSITQEFATETKMRFSQAEEIKLQKGLVGLGGAYAEPEDPHEAALSKIARQVMTRMHVQVNQTIQFWQKQQGGSEPVRLFLHGGATIMPYLPEFLAEKLQMPLEKVRKVMKIAKEPISLETPIGDEEDSQLGDFIEDTTAVSPSEAVIHRSLKEQTGKVLATLTPRQERVPGRPLLGEGALLRAEQPGPQLLLDRSQLSQLTRRQGLPPRGE